jgi:hypothetical protein
VVPGTASVEEAEENARAEHEVFAVSSDHGEPIGQIINEIKATMCSRCGFCDSLCSKNLPVSSCSETPTSHNIRDRGPSPGAGGASWPHALLTAYASG